jgi:hypothetical protein
VKVVDFGIAKAVTGDEAGQKVTKTGLVVGTPEYMSPEQLSGDKLDGRSDIYSLGLVFYRMLTGVLPFQADSAQETMIKRLTDEPMPLAAARPDITFPPELQPVLDKALARLPSERYASAAQFGRDAEAAVAGGEVPRTRVGEPATTAATQLMDAEAALRSIPAKRKPAPAARAAPAKRFPLVPVLGGVGGVAVIAVVAALTLPKLSRKTPPVGTADTLVHRDTTRVPAGTPETTKAGPGGAAERTTRRTSQTAQGSRTGPGPSVTSSGPPAALPDLAAIDRELNAAMDQAIGDAPAAGRATAQRYYNMASLPSAVRAKAAEIVAQSFTAANDTTNYNLWHARAVSLDPKYRMPGQ